MPIFVYRCDCGHLFERLVPRDAGPPACPACGGETRKIPAGPSLGRRGGAHGSTPGPAGSDVPIPWRGIVSGGPEKMHREVDFRRRLEERAAGGLRVPGGPDSHPDKKAGNTGPAPPPVGD